MTALRGFAIAFAATIGMFLAQLLCIAVMLGGILFVASFFVP